jgi:tetratricopeptide (TPR) repeat protein
MTDLRRCALVALFVVAAAGTRAIAQPADTATLEASGQRHYELAEYAAAIADFKEAFRISDQPELLFNIAQAYRLSADCRQALTFYRTYLRRLPGAANAERVRARITEMEACAAKPAPETPVTPPATGAITTTASLPPPPPPPARGRTWKTWAGIGALGAGAIAAGAGVLFAARGSAKSDELRELCATSCSGDDARAIESAGRAANRNATIGFVAGGALVAAGVVLIVLDHRGGGEPTGPAVSVVPGGGAATWTWSF